MTPITRRTLIARGAAATAVAGFGALPARLSAAAPQGTPALFVFDARFARSAALADSHRATGAALLDPREADLGIAWREQIPALLQQGQRIEGLTMWSDKMICEIFARDAGASFTALEISAGDRADTQLQHWWLG